MTKGAKKKATKKREAGTVHEAMSTRDWSHQTFVRVMNAAWELATSEQQYKIFAMFGAVISAADEVFAEDVGDLKTHFHVLEFEAMNIVAMEEPELLRAAAHQVASEAQLDVDESDAAQFAAATKYANQVTALVAAAVQRAERITASGEWP